MHALWNLLVKQSGDKTVFIWWMFVSSWSMMTVVTVSFEMLPQLTLRLVILAAMSASCFVLYHWLGGYAYRDGDLSVTYPLAQTAIFYVPIWGVIFLGETLSTIGIIGILLIALGAYCIQLRKITLTEIARPFTLLKDRSVQAALMAGFIYSIGAIIDKIGIDSYSAYPFTYVLVFFMVVFMSLNLMRPCYRGRIIAEWHRNPKLILCSGPIILASFMTFRYGLQLAPVSYAIPVRQISLLVGVLIGLLFLGESFGRIRIASTGLILVGVFLIWQGWNTYLALLNWSY